MVEVGGGPSAAAGLGLAVEGGPEPQAAAPAAALRFWPRTTAAMTQFPLPVHPHVPCAVLRAAGVVHAGGAPVDLPVRLEVNGKLRPGPHKAKFSMQPQWLHAERAVATSWPNAALQAGGMAAGTALVGFQTQPDLPGTLVAVYASGQRLGRAKKGEPGADSVMNTWRHGPSQAPPRHLAGRQASGPGLPGPQGGPAPPGRATACQAPSHRPRKC
jgi:hypothetical protein